VKSVIKFVNQSCTHNQKDEYKLCFLKTKITANTKADEQVSRQIMLRNALFIDMLPSRTTNKGNSGGLIITCSTTLMNTKSVFC